MRRKKEKTFDPKFDSIIEQADLINDADALLDWYQSTLDLFEGTDRATILEIYTKRRDALIKAKVDSTELVIVYPETEKEEVEAEVVDEPTETVSETQEIEFDDKVGAAFMDYETRGKELYEAYKRVHNEIEALNETLKEKKAFEKEIFLSMAGFCRDGHEPFVKQPTLFDDLEGEVNEF